MELGPLKQAQCILLVVGTLGVERLLNTLHCLNRPVCRAYFFIFLSVGLVLWLLFYAEA